METTDSEYDEYVQMLEEEKEQDQLFLIYMEIQTMNIFRMKTMFQTSTWKFWRNLGKGRGKFLQPVTHPNAPFRKILILVRVQVQLGNVMKILQAELWTMMKLQIPNYRRNYEEIGKKLSNYDFNFIISSIKNFIC